MATLKKLPFAEAITSRLAPKWQDWAALANSEDMPADSVEDLKAYLDAEERLEKEAVQIGDLMRMPGWQLLEEYRQREIKVLHNALERLDVTADASKIRDIQAELRVLRKYENFVLSKITVLG